MTLFTMTTAEGSLIAIGDEAGNETVCAPFRGLPVSRAEFVDDGLVLALSDHHKVVLIDAAQGRVTREIELPFTIRGNCFSHDKRLMLIHGRGELALVTCGQLTLVGHYDSVLWDGDQGRLLPTHATESGAEPLFSPDLAAFRPDGKLVVTYSRAGSVEDDIGAEVCVAIIDPDQGRVARTVIERDPEWIEQDLGFFCITPDGRTALRPGWEALPTQAPRRTMSIGVGASRAKVEPVEDGAPLHRDVESAGKTYYGIQFEKWTLDPCARQVDLVVRMLSYWKGKGHPNLDWMGSDEALPYLAEIAESGVDLPTFMERDRQQGGHIDERPFAVALFSLLGQADRVVWEGQGPAFWVFFADASVRRVAEDGTLSPLIRFERMISSALNQAVLAPEDHLHERRPQNIQVDEAGQAWFTYLAPSGSIDRLRVAASFLDRVEDRVIVPTSSDGYRRLRPQTDPLNILGALSGFYHVGTGLEEGECIAALEALTTAIDNDLDDLITFAPDRRQHLRLFFQFGSLPLTESGFFDHLVEEVPGALGALRRLIEAYVARAMQRGRQEMLHGEDGETPALAHAVRALMILDPGLYDLFLRYFSTVDYARESFIRETLTKLFGERGGWPTWEAVTFGVDWMLTDPNVDLPHLLTHGGLVEAASQLMPPEQFAALCAARAKAHFVLDDGSIDLENSANFYAKCLWSLHDVPTDYNKAVAACFESYQAALWRSQ